MWISKRKWNEMEQNINMVDVLNGKIILMCDTIDRLKRGYDSLKDELIELEKAHEDEICTYMDRDRCTYTKRKYSHRQKEIKASTSNISDITLEELARLVIDREPIVREENVKVKVEYTGLR